MKIERVEEMRLSAALEAQIAALLHEPFAGSFGTRTFFQNRHHVRFCAWDGEALIGHLALALRAVRLGEVLIDVIGIAEVAVAKPARGQGIARDLVTAALEEGRASPARFALLFGDAEIYASSGFTRAANPVTSVPMRAAHTQKPVTETVHPMMVCPLHHDVWDETQPLDLAGFRF